MSDNFFKFSFDKIPEPETNKRGQHQPLSLEKIANVLNNIGVKVSSILKNTGLDPDERRTKLDKEIVNLFNQLNTYLNLAVNKKIDGIKQYEKVPLFKKLQQAITIYDNHEGNIKEALKYLTEIQARDGGSSVIMQEKTKKSTGVWSSELSKAVKELYEDYSNISVKDLNKKSSKKDEKKEKTETSSEPKDKN